MICIIPSMYPFALYLINVCLEAVLMHLMHEGRISEAPVSYRAIGCSARWLILDMSTERN